MQRSSDTTIGGDESGIETNSPYESPQRSEIDRASVILCGCHHIREDINPLCRDRVTHILEH